MQKTILDLSSFEKALFSLEKALKKPKDEFVRDAVIQRFEYTYELAWKMLKRYLVMTEGAETINPLAKKDLFRLAAEKSLIEEVNHWFQYYHARNETSHTYNESRAEEVYEAAEGFLKDAKTLLAVLSERIKNA